MKGENHDKKKRNGRIVPDRRGDGKRLWNVWLSQSKHYYGIGKKERIKGIRIATVPRRRFQRRRRGARNSNAMQRPLFPPSLPLSPVPPLFARGRGMCIG